MKINETVACCYNGSRIKNETIVKMTKSYIELSDGSRYSIKSKKQILTSNGTKGDSYQYINEDVAYWDQYDMTQKFLKELNSNFNQLSLAAKDRNWKSVKECFNALSNLIKD